MGTTISSQSKSLGVLAITNADKDLYEVNGRTLVSARLGVDAPDGRWAVFGWGRNIFNKYYRSDEPTSELQSLMRISYDVFCLTKKKRSNHPLLFTYKNK